MRKLERGTGTRTRIRTGIGWRSWLQLPLLLTCLSLPASATLIDSEPANDDPALAPVGLAGGLIADAGIFSLEEGDVDYLRFPSLGEGAIFTAIVTPFGADADLLDTVLGLFRADGSLVAFNDDAGGTEPGDSDLVASALRYVVEQAGDFVLGVSGVGDFGDGGDFFEGDHFENGSYVLTVSIIPEPGTVLLLGGGLVGLALARRGRSR